MNNKYIKKQEYKYIVISEARMVVCECTIEINWWDLKNGIFHNVPNDWDKNVESVFKYSNCPVFTVRAIARAHPDDVFDETKGKRIAKSKANIKAYHKIKACLKEMFESVYNIEKNLIEHYNDIEYLMRAECNHLDDLKY